jgi:hypothetical protein
MCARVRAGARDQSSSSGTPGDAVRRYRLLGLSPGRTASLPGGLARRQLRAAEPRPDRLGILDTLCSRVIDFPDPRLSMDARLRESTRFGRFTRHLFSRDAELDRERLSRRCVGWRREEPAARRRATNGPIHERTTVVVAFPRTEFTKSFAVLHRAPGQRRSTWVAACVVLISAGRRGMTSQASAFVEIMQSTRQRRLARKQRLLLARRLFFATSFVASPFPPRGLCRPVASLADFHLTRVE